MPVWLQVVLTVTACITGITGPISAYLCVWSIKHHRRDSGPLLPFRRRVR